MISWNEAKTISLALKGIVGLVDEVIIADSGSFDGTQEIARQTIEQLGLNGRVMDVKAKSIGQARIAAYNACTNPWILLIDANLVFSDQVNKKLLKLTEIKPKAIGCVRSVNLMGDYEHYFSGLPVHAPHASFFRKDNKRIRFTEDRDRPTITNRKGLTIITPNVVNLSRVRPAWRCWYRGEPFDKRFFKRYGKGKTGHATPTNRQNKWNLIRKYFSLVEFVEDTEGLSLDDVKRVAPEWYLRQLRTYAKPLDANMRRRLPQVIKQEIQNPQYKLTYAAGKITGRWPEL